MATTKSRRDPNHRRWKRVVKTSILFQEYRIPIKDKDTGDIKAMAKGVRQFVHLTYVRRNGETGRITFRRNKQGKYIREKIHLEPETRRIVRRWMPRIGGGTGQTERKPVSFKYDRHTGGTKETVQKFEYTYSDIERLAASMKGE